ncbi:MAG: hypothetical protein J0L75_15045 [Spirochaetes bacterium]|nr:hypothetical protein [Spirochaetota bacterium]
MVTVLCALFLGAEPHLSRTSTNAPPDHWVFSNQAAFYYRAAQMAEITGNEQSLVAWWRTRLAWDRAFGPVSLEAKLDGLLMADLAVKGRVAETMAPPRVLLNELSLNLGLGKHHRLEAGAVRPLTWHYPLESLAVPVVFATGVLPNGRYLPQAIVTGYRDVPIAYAGAIDWYDIGLIWRMDYPGIRFSLGYINGEQGLDANSSPSASFELRFGRDSLFGGLAGQFGQQGSVPVKEWRHQAQVFFQAGKRHRFGVEAMLHLGGVMNTNALAPSNGLLSQFGYDENPFGPFTLVNDENHENPFGLDPVFVPAFHAMAWFELSPRLDDRLKIAGHFSVWDPDLVTESREDKKLKWRAFLRVSVGLLPPLKVFVSYTWTQDPVFLNRNLNQYFDRESRDLHPLVPHDILAGMALEF